MGIQVAWYITLLPLVNIQASFLEVENIKTFGDFGISLPNITVDTPQDLYFRFVCLFQNVFRDAANE